MIMKQSLTGLSISIVILIVSIALTACSPRATARNTPAPSQEIKPVATATATPAAAATATATPAPGMTATATPADASQRTFTKDQLAKYDGLNGNPAYIAVSGVVYDVSNVKQWRTGRHQGYTAGLDLTDAIQQSPHGTSVLDGLPIVGKYVQ